MSEFVVEVEDVVGLNDISLFNLPEEPLRNLDLDAHGRNTAAEACVVTVAIVAPTRIPAKKRVQLLVELWLSGG